MPPNIFDGVLTDIWIGIFYHLSVTEIISTRLVCRKLNAISRVRAVWINAARKELLSNGFPLPRCRKPLKDLTGPELETCVTRGVQLYANFSAMDPSPTSVFKSADQAPAEETQGRYITQVLFVKGDNGSTWLLSSGAGCRISCFEVLSEPLSLLPAGRWDSPSTLLDVVANKVYGSEATLAVSTQNRFINESYCTLIIQMSNLEHGKIPIFTTLSTIQNPSGRLHLLHGDHVLFFRKRRSICNCINWKTKVVTEYHIQRDDEMGAVPIPPRAIAVHDRRLVVLTTQAIHLWRFEPDSAPTTGSPRFPFYTHQIGSIGAPGSGEVKADAGSLAAYNLAWKLDRPLQTTGPSPQMCFVTRRRTSQTSDILDFRALCWDPSDTEEDRVQMDDIGHWTIPCHFCADTRLFDSGICVTMTQADSSTRGSLESIGFANIRKSGGGAASIFKLPKATITVATAMDYDSVEGFVVVGDQEGMLTLLDLS